MAESTFLADIRNLCERARQDTEQAATYAATEGDPDKAIRLLNEALATEMVGVLRYKRHYFMASGANAQTVADEFLRHASDEQAHADRIALRIVQLGGEPNFSPDGMLSRSHSEYVKGDSVIDMIREDLVAELVVIESYREMINHFGSADPNTRRLLEDLLTAEEAHLGDLATLLEKSARRH